VLLLQCALQTGENEEYEVDKEEDVVQLWMKSCHRANDKKGVYAAMTASAKSIDFKIKALSSLSTEVTTAAGNTTAKTIDYTDEIVKLKLASGDSTVPSYLMELGLYPTAAEHLRKQLTAAVAEDASSSSSDATSTQLSKVNNGGATSAQVIAVSARLGECLLRQARATMQDATPSSNKASAATAAVTDSKGNSKSSKSSSSSGVINTGKARRKEAKAAALAAAEAAAAAEITAEQRAVALHDVVQLCIEAVPLLQAAVDYSMKTNQPQSVTTLRLALALQLQAAASRNDALLDEAAIPVFVQARVAFGTLQCYDRLASSDRWESVSADRQHQQQAISAALEMVQFAEAVAAKSEAQMITAFASEALFDLTRPRSMPSAREVCCAYSDPLRELLKHTTEDPAVRTTNCTNYYC
jgi:hypothetical protein